MSGISPQPVSVSPIVSRDQNQSCHQDSETNQSVHGDFKGRMYAKPKNYLIPSHNFGISTSSTV